MLAHLDVNDLYYLERSFTTDGLACQTYDPRIAGLVAGEVLMQWVAGKPPAPARRLIPSEKPFWWRQPIEMNAPLPPREELSGETDEISLPPLVVSADLFRA